MPKRNANIDLARIIATILVIILHILGKGGILQNSSPDKALYWAAWFLEISAYCAVNCFALISGYVMSDKRVRIKNISNLWFQVLFYSVLISVLFFIFAPETRTIKNVVFSVLPVLGEQWWYITAYFGLFFFIPILNVAINHINRDTFRKVLLVILFGICVADCIIPDDTFLLDRGYSAIWLIILYLFGAYIKKYNIQQKITAAKSLIGFFAMVVLTFLSKVFIRFGTKALFGEIKYEATFISYISITIVFSAIFLFLFCLNLKTNRTAEKIILFFAPATLGVYLIHVHPKVFGYIFYNAFLSFTRLPAALMFVYTIIAALIIFLLCSFIDLLRIQLFKLLRVNKLSEFIENKITYLYSKAFNSKT